MSISATSPSCQAIILDAIVEALAEAGATAKMIAAAVKAYARVASEQLTEKRRQDAERQRRSRANRAVTVTQKVSSSPSYGSLDGPPPLHPSPPIIPPSPSPSSSKNLRCVVVPIRPLDKNAELTDEYREAAKERGLNNDTTQDEFRKFKNFNAMKGSSWADWVEVWRRWLTRVEQPKEQPMRSPETDEQRLSRLRAERLAREAA